MRNVGYIGHWILDMARLHRISVQSISYTPNEVAQETKHKGGLMRLSHFVATKHRWHKYIYDGAKKWTDEFYILEWVCGVCGVQGWGNY